MLSLVYAPDTCRFEMDGHRVKIYHTSSPDFLKKLLVRKSATFCWPRIHSQVNPPQRPILLSRIPVYQNAIPRPWLILCLPSFLEREVTSQTRYNSASIKKLLTSQNLVLDGPVSKVAIDVQTNEAVKFLFATRPHGSNLIFLWGFAFRIPMKCCHRLFAVALSAMARVMCTASSSSESECREVVRYILYVREVEYLHSEICSRMSNENSMRTGKAGFLYNILIINSERRNPCWNCNEILSLT